MSQSETHISAVRYIRDLGFPTLKDLTQLKLHMEVCNVYNSRDMIFPGDQQRLRPACAYAQSDQSLCSSLEYSTNIELLTEQHLEFLSLKRDCICSSESIHVKMPHCCKSHVEAHIVRRYIVHFGKSKFCCFGVFFAFCFGLFWGLVFFLSIEQWGQRWDIRHAYE